MVHKFDPKHAHKLESEERRRSMPPERTLRRLGLKRGMTFVDAGAGTGYFAMAAADLVGPEGKIYAIDVEPAMLRALKAKKPPRWLVPVQCDEARFPIPDAVADLTLACFVLHETHEPEAFLRELGRVTKPYAPIRILEWAKRRQPEGPPFQERIHHHRAEALVLQAGLCFQGLEFFNPSQYAVTAFRKPP
jgi:ubiquinone/menaquinone biosynthesis C-methylase UbiE